MAVSIPEKIKDISVKFDDVTIAMIIVGIIAIAALLHGGSDANDIVRIAVTGILALAGNRVRK